MEVVAAKLDDLSSVLGTYMVERENQPAPAHYSSVFVTYKKRKRKKYQNKTHRNISLVHEKYSGILEEKGQVGV